VDVKLLNAVEKWTLVLAATAVAVALLALGRKTGFSLTAGAALAAGNAWVIRKIGERLGRYKEVLQQRPGMLLVLFNLKMGLYVVLVWIALRYLHLHAIPFIIGISLLPLAIIIVAIEHALNPREENHG
jgi:hypothetical protein